MIVQYLLPNFSLLGSQLFYSIPKVSTVKKDEWTTYWSSLEVSKLKEKESFHISEHYCIASRVSFTLT